MSTHEHGTEVYSIKGRFERGDKLEDILLDQMDWELLREQKRLLFEAIDLVSKDHEGYDTDKIHDALNGIVHLIDHVQDIAVDGGFVESDVVFERSDDDE